MKNNWFEVDKEGLAKLLRRRGMEFVLFELLQNAWDTGATHVEVTLKAGMTRGRCILTIEDDDPNGFKDLAHAYTLFAESSRKSDPTKRGRFNLGEKLILAVCDYAEIASTTGTVIFDGPRRRSSRQCRDKGTKFTGTIRMTQEEMKAVLEAAQLVIAPVFTSINGEALPIHRPRNSFEVTLPTEIADEEGILRRTARKTEVRVYEHEGTSYLYEMGIPVVETDDPWSVEVMQKVPLNADRDNVTPAYLREVRVHVLNQMRDVLLAKDAARPAVIEALTDERIEPETVNVILTHQYGPRRAIFDPSDREANNRLVAEGYSLIQGGAFSGAAWQNIKAAGAAKPSGQIAPSYRPYSENGTPAQYVDPEDWTAGMKNIADYIEALSPKLIARSVQVRFEKGRFTAPFAANYGGGCLTFNFDKLGRKFFDKCRSDQAVNDLLIHELAHEYGEHLSDAFDKAMSRIGAKLLTIALEEPRLFRN